jgi:CheY-like chemotaxis protein/HPt (histidine-containing phosphotransfer) domain-containing protein
MVTSLGSRGISAELAELGFAGYVSKPVRQSQLYDCIAQVLGKDRQAAAVAPKAVVAATPVAATAKRTIRILLVEDNVINQKVAQSILNKLGYKADVVADGQEAVNSLELIDYDLVLMDCQMPVMDGFEATRLIRDGNSAVLDHTVPIVAMTANAMKGDREECITCGMNDYLAKPVKKEELALILDKWLKSEPAPQNNGGAAAEKPAKQAEPTLFDEAELLDNFDGDREFAKSILDDALIEIPEDVARLGELCRLEDLPAARLLAHTLKGMSANICAPGLRELAFKIETASKGDDAAAVLMLLPELERTAQLTMAAIGAFK